MVNYIMSAVDSFSRAVVENTKKGVSQNTRNSFKQPSFGQKAGTVGLTILASPLLIIGGIATFGKMVDYFSTKNTKQIQPADANQTTAKTDKAAGRTIQNSEPNTPASYLKQEIGWHKGACTKYLSGNYQSYEENDLKNRANSTAEKLVLFHLEESNDTIDEKVEESIIESIKKQGEIRLSMGGLQIMGKDLSISQEKIPKIKEILEKKLGLTLEGDPTIEKHQMIFHINKST